MPKYDVVATINVTVDAGNRQWARAAVNGVFDGAWWRNTDIGFSTSRFKIDCNKIKINKMSKKNA